MSNAYENALGTVADAYERAYADHGGKSLSRVATIVVSSGAFFQRLRAGKTFSVQTLDRFAEWFRVPANWPDRIIPHDACCALISIGRPPVDVSAPHQCRTVPMVVDCDQPTTTQLGLRA
ncbi:MULTISPECIES: hypothetical protein [unclassified Sphingomonas]|uniref:hypothetical protein n=1 Tax=unclassified Sphingomonas TaxID=196159 RepID=UPI002269CE19|nr:MULTISPECIES: hypothetical protein [unclassified Sphingomonas]